MKLPGAPIALASEAPLERDMLVTAMLAQAVSKLTMPEIRKSLNMMIPSSIGARLNIRRPRIGADEAPYLNTNREASRMSTTASRVLYQGPASLVALLS